MNQNESRPAKAAPEVITATSLIVAQGADVEPRAGGTVRVTFERTASGTCTACGCTFPSTGAAASHARAARHTVACTYSARFAFVPTETLDGAR